MEPEFWPVTLTDWAICLGVGVYLLQFFFWFTDGGRSQAQETADRFGTDYWHGYMKETRETLAEIERNTRP